MAPVKLAAQACRLSIEMMDKIVSKILASEEQEAARASSLGAASFVTVCYAIGYEVSNIARAIAEACEETMKLGRDESEKN